MDEDMKRNRIFLIFLCCFSVGMAAYSAFVCYALNRPRREPKGAAGAVVSAIAGGSDAPAGEAGGARDSIEESRAVLGFKTENYPALIDAIDEAAGFDLPVEVEWNSLAAEGWSHLYETAFPKVYFLPIVRALESFSEEAPGKDGLQLILTKVVIKNSGRYFNSNGISLDSGVLTIDHQPQANVDEGGDERADRILELLKGAASLTGGTER